MGLGPIIQNSGLVDTQGPLYVHDSVPLLIRGDYVDASVVPDGLHAPTLLAILSTTPRTSLTSMCTASTAAR